MTYAGVVQTASILLLSDEILVRIFKEVYYASCDIDLDYATPSSLADPSLFPRCIANVCKRWRHVVKSVPLFATRVMVFVDGPIVLADLAEELKASDRLLIKVFVIRRDYPDAGDPREKSVVRHVIKEVAKHIKRCQVLVFDLLHSTSLPHRTDFSNVAPKLRTLRVKSRKAEPLGEVCILDQLHNGSKKKAFSLRNLQYLDLYGHFLLESLSDPDWCASIRQLSRKQFCASHLHGLGLASFNLRQFMISLSRLGHLTKLLLRDIELDTLSCMKAPASVYIQNFEFEDLSRDFVSGFFRAYENTIDVSNMTLRRCQLGRYKFFSSWNLALQDIPANEDVTEFVSHWDGYSLQLNNCPRADDQLLETLCTPFKNPNGRTDSRSRFLAPTLRELNINFAENSPSSISAEGVKEFVIRRMAAAKDGHIPLPMHSVFATGQAPPITANDKSWLQDNLEFFTWSSPQDTFRLPTDYDLFELDNDEPDTLGRPCSPSSTLMSSSQLVSNSSLPPSQALSSASQINLTTSDVCAAPLDYSTTSQSADGCLKLDILSMSPRKSQPPEK